MNRKVAIVAGVALLTAGGVAAFFYSMLANGAGEEAPLTAAVVVATRDLERGSRLLAGDLRVDERPIAEIPPDAFATPDAVEGRYLMRDTPAGRPITEAHLPAEGNEGLAAAIPWGMRAVTVHVDEYSGVHRILAPGDRVDVLAASWPRNPGRQEITVTTVLQDVEVFASDREVKAGERTIPAVTLLVDAEQAATISLADQAGAVRLSLRNPADAGVIEAADARGRDVLNQRAPSKLTPTRGRPAPPADRPSAGAQTPAASEAAPASGERAALGGR